jgi:hypothetical protein
MEMRMVNVSTAASGATSAPITVSDIAAGDWTLHVWFQAPQPVTVFCVIEQTTNGFTAQQPLMIINEAGLSQRTQRVVRARELPGAKVGVVGAQIRLRFLEISGGTVDAQLRIEF